VKNFLLPLLNRSLQKSDCKNLKNQKIQKQENKQGNGSVLPVSQSQIPFLFTYILKESTSHGYDFSNPAGTL